MQQHHRLENAVNEALGAFMATIAKHFPEVQTGVVALATPVFTQSCKSIVEAWIYNAERFRDAPLGILLNELLATKSYKDLDELMYAYADSCSYHQRLDVMWNYWHFGRHAEFAAECGMDKLSKLFSAAWKIQHDVHVDDNARSALARAAIQAAFA